MIIHMVRIELEKFLSESNIFQIWIIPTLNSQEHTEFFLKVVFGFAIFTAVTIYAVSTKIKKELFRNKVYL